jgi:large subunit ribosomal protein L19e
MNLTKKKELASRVLGVGKGRILFIDGYLNEIKEAITRQDILDLQKAGAIQIREIAGRRKVVKRKNRRRVGKVKLKPKTRKQDYVIMTRGLRKLAKHLLLTKKITREDYREKRKQIRARKFRSKRHLKESLE